MRGVGLEISFATPGEIVVMFGFIEAFIFQAPHILKAVCEGSMTPLPAVLALWDTRIHVHPFNSSNKATNVEASIYKFFGCRSILWIPDVDPDDGYIKFRGDFDNIGLGIDVNVVEYVGSFNECLHYFRVDRNVGTF